MNRGTPRASALLNTCPAGLPGTALLAPSALRAWGAVVPAAREWRGNGRKAHTSEGAN